VDPYDQPVPVEVVAWAYHHEDRDHDENRDDCRCTDYYYYCYLADPFHVHDNHLDVRDSILHYQEDPILVDHHHAEE